MGSFVVEPLVHGYGTTLGNALRRVLLSSLPGCALTAVKVIGATHEFTTLDGVKEDMVELTLNLKQVRLKVMSEHPVRLMLNKKGKGVVTAADFEKNSDVEIVNPDLVLATITDEKASLRLEVVADTGRGYVPVEAREKEEAEVGLMKLDAMFSPVRSVAMRVEPVRVGDITNFDRLVMDVETDGSLSPQEAVRSAVTILMDHLQLCLNQIA
jgi:DNA-directed RNA polymerase subunit alpha